MPALTDAIVGELLPGFDPSPDFVPEGVSPGDVAEGNSIYRWLTALQWYDERLRWGRELPGFQYATYGFIPIDSNNSLPNGVRSSGGYVFGIAHETEPVYDAPSQVVQSFSEMQGVTLARVINRRRIAFHTPNPTMPMATGACWGQSTKPAIWPASDGVLTAAHAVTGISLGANVSMSNGYGWCLGDRGTCKIDAALIVQAGCIPAHAAPLAVERHPCSLTQVQFDGAASLRTITAKITHTVLHPGSLDESNPMRIFLDTFGVPGDSGALVLDPISQKGVGLYMGALGTEGVAQLLAQAAYSLQVDLFL